MLHNMKELSSYDILATDGSIGTVHDLLIDDKYWTVRYLVVDTMKWLPGRKVLISPMSINDFDFVNGNVALSLTKEMIKNSPSIEADFPVSKKYEIEYNKYFGLRPYWSGERTWGSYFYPTELARVPVENDEIVGEVEDPESSNLRSFKAISGYGIEAKDGDIGHVENFVINDETWNVRYLVVDTKNWWPGKHVLVSPHWINYISWVDKVVRIDLSRDTIKNGPEYDPNQSISKEFEDEIFTKYDKDRPWFWY
ncbi:hypothetical protein BKP35_01440 [Anaerobacillus arseniciselenatis]|uniref:PRC-barrel domain-containing protein n=1 Tax=Anaerobacillus arseniciselenatis TaxID=85682 RepID=A0A1S2LTM4_9BACI|nr:PRC-barrel domain-containing protein [Anaerobacillus arseniciselenatis]OIJ15684.1 hypothetical protein BKP35_01440 [Anaerobacillus arseniciselenatis]